MLRLHSTRSALSGAPPLAERSHDPDSLHLLHQQAPPAIAIAVAGLLRLLLLLLPLELRAEGGVAVAVGEAAAESGVEAEQLPHALAPGARGAGVAPGEVADEQLDAPARRRVARARRLGRGLAHGAHLRAALRADVLQAVHGVAQLHVRPLLRTLPPPPAPPLHQTREKPSACQSMLVEINSPVSALGRVIKLF